MSGSAYLEIPLPSAPGSPKYHETTASTETFDEIDESKKKRARRYCKRTNRTEPYSSSSSLSSRQCTCLPDFLTPEIVPGRRRRNKRNKYSKSEMWVMQYPFAIHDSKVHAVRCIMSLLWFDICAKFLVKLNMYKWTYWGWCVETDHSTLQEGNEKIRSDNSVVR